MTTTTKTFPTHVTLVGFLSCVSSHVCCQSILYHWTVSHTRHTCMVSLLCEFSCVLSKYPFHWTSHTCHTCMVSLLNRLTTTHATFVGFLSCVSSHVWPLVKHLYCVNSLFTEPFPTHVTLVRFLSCVSSHVCCQNTLYTEPFPTHATLVGFLSCVSSHVFCQMTTTTKTFPTHITHCVSSQCFSPVWVLMCVLSKYPLHWTLSHTRHTWRMFLLFLMVCYVVLNLQV